VLSVRFDSQGEKVVSGGQDGKTAYWLPNVDSPATQDSHPHGSWVTGAVYWTNNELAWYVSTGTNGLISFRKDDKRLQTIDPRCGALYCLDIFREGKRLVSGGEDGVVRMYALDPFADGSVSESGQYKGHTDAVKCVATSADGVWILSGGEDKTVRLWKAP
jgi:WD40 repeat protein